MPQTSLGSRWFGRICQVPPFGAAIAAVTLGTLMCLLSFPAGLATVSCPSGKQAGFVFEINWVVNFMLVLPSCFYLAGQTVGSIGNAVRNMADAQMIVDAKGHALSAEEAWASWQELAGKVMPICALLVLAAIGEGIGEWYTHSYLPISHRSLAHVDPEYACTWAVAAVLQPAQIGALTNHLFSLAMFIGQGVAASFYLSLVTVVLAFAYWIDRFNRRPELPDLVPALESTDRRLGFELIEPFVQNLFLSALAFAAALFLVRLQFLFFGNPSPSTSVYGFVLDDVAAGFFRGFKALFAGDVSLFSAGNRLVWSTVGAIAAFLILLMISFVIVSVVLRQAAVRARDVYVHRRQQLEKALHPTLSPEQQDQRVRGMVFWPLSYPGPLNLLFIMSFSVAAFVFYRLTLIVVGITMLLGARRFMAILSKKEGNVSQPIAPRPQAS